MVMEVVVVREEEEEEEGEYIFFYSQKLLMQILQKMTNIKYFITIHWNRDK